MLVKLEDIGVVEVSQDLDLICEPLRILDFALFDGLASSDLPTLLVQNSLDRAKRASAQNVLFVNLVELRDRVLILGDHARLFDQKLLKDLGERRLFSFGFSFVHMFICFELVKIKLYLVKNRGF
jgi:hypothetical protein